LIVAVLSKTASYKELAMLLLLSKTTCTSGKKRKINQTGIAKMDGKERTKDVYFGTSFEDVLYELRNRSNLKICGGCTYLKALPPVSLIIRNIKDFQLIEKRERYIEIGAGVTLASIMELGEKNVPPVLYQALNSIATPMVRNIAPRVLRRHTFRPRNSSTTQFCTTTRTPTPPCLSRPTKRL
jgi:hypothetical protein